MLRLTDLLNEGFTGDERTKIKDAVVACFERRGDQGVRNYKTLNNYLSKLDFDVDPNDITIGRWIPNTYNRQIKSADIELEGVYLGSLQDYS
jgi:hypothetical protein